MSDADSAVRKVIGVEEHAWTAELRDALVKFGGDDTVTMMSAQAGIDRRLLDVSDARLARMDAAGVDVEILSITTPGTQPLRPAESVPLARDANDFLADAVRAHPSRFAAFATLPTPDPEAAAGELERSVTRLGLVGALLFPRTGEEFLDHEKFRPVFEVAAQLRVPLYIHPALPPRPVRDVSYSGFSEFTDMILSAGGWGWHAEAGLAALRLILAGTFDRHPDLQVILGDFWTAHGFVVIQPTHLDSRTVGLPRDDPRTHRIWRFRVEDMKRILDQLDLLEGAVPGLRGRLDRSRIAAAGHSFGGQTAGNLLGLRVVDPETKKQEDLSDPRIKAGVLITTAGEGGANLTPIAAEHFAYMNPSFADMTTPALVIAGDQDDIPRKYQLTVRGPDWMAEPYFLSPGRKSLLTAFGADHFLGGISGYEVKETTDENPAQVALVQQVTWAYLRHALDIEDSSWQAAQKALSGGTSRLGRIESKSEQP
jgi:predicted TIM-barrel fold metal-dependent hydrolase